MKEILTIKVLSGKGFIIRIDDREYGFDSWDTLSKYIGDSVAEIMWPKGNKSVNSCTLTIETE